MKLPVIERENYTGVWQQYCSVMHWSVLYSTEDGRPNGSQEDEQSLTLRRPWLSRGSVEAHPASRPVAGDAPRVWWLVRGRGRYSDILSSERQNMVLIFRIYMLSERFFRSFYCFETPKAKCCIYSIFLHFCKTLPDGKQSIHYGFIANFDGFVFDFQEYLPMHGKGCTMNVVRAGSPSCEAQLSCQKCA